VSASATAPNAPASRARAKATSVATMRSSSVVGASRAVAVGLGEALGTAVAGLIVAVAAADVDPLAGGALAVPPTVTSGARAQPVVESTTARITVASRTNALGLAAGDAAGVEGRHDDQPRG